MKFSITILIILFISASFFLIGAGNKLFQPDPLPFVVPKGWPKPAVNIFAQNKLTRQGFELGKKIFYDPQLSKDGEVSCSSCHQPFAAFSNYDHPLSHGVNNSFTTRNAPALINLAWMKEMHWDGAINHIEVQPLAPITAANEMGETIENVLLKLKRDTSYARHFKAAFGDPAITSQRMLKALAQFTGSLVSSNSKYDKVKEGKAVFTAYEKKGYDLFRQHCATCHKEPLFTDNSYRNNGLPLNKINDIGRQAVTYNPEDSLKFKVPTLRNTQLSFPYMHDGRFYSLYDVVDHYRTGIKADQKNLDKMLRSKINITDKQRSELVLFLYTLTDSSFVSNQLFNPSGEKGSGHNHP